MLFLGSAEGFSQSPDWSKSNCYGESGSGGGDINGDGYDDLIIGDGDCSPGNVYIHLVLSLEFRMIPAGQFMDQTRQQDSEAVFQTQVILTQMDFQIS
ncbi:MAG: FG-GAP repeat protein [Ignavibacteria bacterium]|nr:FG-GAP repeat protein [Ignavibacteria bacterium]